MAFGGSTPFGGGGQQKKMGGGGMVPFGVGGKPGGGMASANPNAMAGIAKLIAMRRMLHGAAGMPGGMQTPLPRL